MNDVAEPMAVERPRGVLRRELRVWEAFAISVGIMAPTAAMALNGTLPERFLWPSFWPRSRSRVSYSFIRLTSYFNHAGSAYALVVVMLFAVVDGTALRVNGTTSVNAFFYMGTIGVLGMLVAYIVVNIGAMRFLHLGRREAPWRVIVSILAVVALVYVIYKNVWPRLDYPYDNFTLMVGAWLLVGIAIALLYPGSRAGSGSVSRSPRTSGLPVRRARIGTSRPA